MKMTLVISFVGLLSTVAFAKGLNKKLLDAVLDGDIQKAQALITLGADVNFTVAGEESLLICAAERGNPQITALLIANGANIDHRAKNGETALVRAAALGRFQVVQELLSHRVATDLMAEEGGAPLHHAAQRRDFPMVRILLEGGADIDLQDPLGRSALHLAATFPNPEIAEFLLTSGADSNLKDLEGKTPLMYAVMANNLQTSRSLLQNGANPAIADAMGTTPIEKVEPWNQDLLDMFAHPRTALMEDIQVSPAIDLMAIQQLLASGKSLNQPDLLGATPIFDVIESGDLDALELLVSHDADVNHANNDGVTPLMLAVALGRATMVEVLLKHHAKTESLSNNGYAALYLAGIRKDKTLAEMLFASGATWIGKYYDKPIWLWQDRREYKYLLEKIRWLPNLTQIDPHSKYPEGISIDPNPEGVVDISYPNLVAPVVTRNPPPIYPEHRRNSKVHGSVILEAVITKSGKVRDVKLLLGMGTYFTAFDNAAIKVAKTWRFKPGTLNGEPKEVRMPIEVYFEKIKGVRGNF